MPEKTAQQADIRSESELDQPRWAVISFERREAAGLTYTEASAKVDELEARNVSGVCLVTDDVAERVNP